jgi:hypothetical protein
MRRFRIELGTFCVDVPLSRQAAKVSALRAARMLRLRGHRQTRSSLGKSLLKFIVVGEKTCQLIGLGLSVLRQGFGVADPCRQGDVHGVRADRPPNTHPVALAAVLRDLLGVVVEQAK